ncbi:MAG: TonB-dependent receptor, partial [Chlorobi bacterium]|nr:TonB-dependent receptor [Chlorobiota bacterium]
MNVILGATQRKSQLGFNEAFRYATIYNPTAPVKDSDPKFDIYDGYFQQVLFDYYNPVQILEEDKNDDADKIINISLKGSYEIVKGLSVDAFYSVQRGSCIGGQYYDKNSYWVGMDRNGLADQRMDNSSSRLFESTAHWDGQVGGANLTVLGGYTYQDFTNAGFHARGGDFITDAFSYDNLSAALDFNNGKGTVQSYKNSSKLIAFFGRVNLNVTDNWFLMASARYEGSSRFGED